MRVQEEEVEVVEEEGGRKKRRKVSELRYTYDADMEGRSAVARLYRMHVHRLWWPCSCSLVVSLQAFP